MIVTEGIVDEQDIDTEKQEEYVQLTMDSFYEEFCSCLFVRQSDNKRYGYLKKRLPRGRQKLHKKMVESKTLIEYCQGPYSTQPEPIENKEEDGCVAFLEESQNDVVNKSPKEKCHGCTMVNNHFLSD